MSNVPHFSFPCPMLHFPGSCLSNLSSVRWKKAPGTGHISILSEQDTFVVLQRSCVHSQNLSYLHGRWKAMIMIVLHSRHGWTVALHQWSQLLLESQLHYFWHLWLLCSEVNTWWNRRKKADPYRVFSTFGTFLPWGTLQELSASPLALWSQCKLF